LRLGYAGTAFVVHHAINIQVNYSSWHT